MGVRRRRGGDRPRLLGAAHRGRVGGEECVHAFLDGLRGVVVEVGGLHLRRRRRRLCSLQVCGGTENRVEGVACVGGEYLMTWTRQESATRMLRNVSHCAGGDSRQAGLEEKRFERSTVLCMTE